jgi:hypothetical protein
MRATTRIFRGCLAAAMGILFWGCGGTGNDQAPKLSQTGQHPAGWQAAHASDYAKHPDQCATCHGSFTDPASTGGISKVSCFSCHASGPGHPKGWSAALQHGRLGAQQVAGEWTGMASCGKCHGDNLKGGLSAVSCTQCHTKAPHPDRPWLGANPNTQSNHSATDVSNAPECFKCHAGGSNSTLTPGTPALGAAPGCYNNTMCHGTP